MNTKTLILILLLLFFLPINNNFAYPVKFIDDNSQTCIVDKKPSRVVCLVPAITEIIYRLEAQDALKGITYHSTLPGTSDKAIIGGFFEPSFKAILALKPDLLIISDRHDAIKERFKESNIQIIVLKTNSISDGMDTITLLGDIFNKKELAKQIISENNAQIALITRKLSNIAPEKKLRVMRIMGRDTLMTPGSNSFQNDLIQRAGGIVHNFSKNGDVVPVTKEEWMQFNPQVLYGCGKDRELEKLLFNQPGWKDVDAIRNRRIYYFPCDLTCRAATHTGYFVQWLASSIYGKTFALKENLFLENAIAVSRTITTDFQYIKSIQVVDSHILDFSNKSLIIDLKTPMIVVSTLDGQRQGIQTIVNHYTPPQNWQIDHDHGVDSIRKRISQALDRELNKTSILITGAHMENLSVKKAKFKDLEVRAFVTAGVRSNAMQMGKSEGLYYEPKAKPGTINIILMTNMKLAPRAMTRAIITATEAKTAALLDMDIRTSYDNGKFRATGTGTDNVLVLEGTGTLLKASGGHTKLGELMASVVYEGVKEAVLKQNGLDAQRNIFLRLKERGITVYDLVASDKNCDCKRDSRKFVGKVEELLLDPRYAGFIQMALSISDDYEKGLIKDLSAFKLYSETIATQIAQGRMETFRPLIKIELPEVIKIGFNALLNGIYYKDRSYNNETP